MTAEQRGSGRSGRGYTPYTDEERRQLKDWHALATTVRSTTPVGSPSREAGEQLCQLIAEKKKEGFSWRELAEPLDLQGRTLHSYLSRHGYTKTKVPPQRAYQNTSINVNHRTETHYPCGIHRIGIDPSYKSSKPGGPPRCATCEREKRNMRYHQAERPRELARRQGIEEKRRKHWEEVSFPPALARHQAPIDAARVAGDSAQDGT